MNVLMANSERTWRGGEGQLWLLMQGLLDRSFHVGLIAPPGSAIAERARGTEIEVTTMPIGGGADLRAAWKLRSVLRSGRWDIIHTHSSHAHSVAFTALSLWRGERRPNLVVSRRVDFPVATNRFSAMKYRHHVDAYIAISNGVRDVLLRGGVDADRVALVRSGIDLGKFRNVDAPERLLDEFEVPHGAPVVGNVAALAPHKSQADFIRAAVRVTEFVPDARFFIVGEGTLRHDLEALIREVGMEERVVLTGFREDVLVFLKMFDCFVLSSYLEGLCTSIMDAHVSGVPVVATDTGGVPDLVEHEVTGLLVPPRDPVGLGDAVCRILRDRELRDRCVTGALARASSYDYVHMVDGTADVYRRLSGGVTTPGMEKRSEM